MRGTSILALCGLIWCIGVVIQYWWVLVILVAIMVLSNDYRTKQVAQPVKSQAHYSNRR